MSKVHPYNSHLADSGFAPGYERRHASAEAQAKRQESHRRAEYRRAIAGNALSSALPELPDSFVLPAMERLKVHVRIGNWEQAHETLYALEREHAIVRQAPAEKGLTVDDPIAQLRLARRTEEMCEANHIFTIGDLFKGFPGVFIGLRQCGPVKVREIASALVSVGLLTAEQAAEAVQTWDFAMEAR